MVTSSAWRDFCEKEARDRATNDRVNNKVDCFIIRWFLKKVEGKNMKNYCINRLLFDDYSTSNSHIAQPLQASGWGVRRNNAMVGAMSANETRRLMDDFSILQPYQMRGTWVS